MSKKINVAIVGLGFGAEFIPLWQKHPHATCYAICQRNADKLNAVGDYFGVDVRYQDFAELLKDKNVDVVHINSPIPDHAWMSIAALKAGKHVACTVPMATSIADCKKIVELVKKTGLKYMMMETVVYAREYLFMKELLDKGELGKLQFVQASHQQDMDGWPNYWPGLPPMWYATHCVGPVSGLIGAPAEYVSCFGSGTIRKELVKCYGSPFAVETGASDGSTLRRVGPPPIAYSCQPRRSSTMSARPIPCLPPISFNRVRRATGSSLAPFTDTGVPFSKPMVTSSGVIGASAGSAVSMNRSFGGTLFGSSSTPPSCEMCQMLRSRE